MKKLLFIALLPFIAFSCGQSTVPKPKKLLSENTMADIMYDIALLQSIKSFNPAVLDSNNVDTPKYIYQKYKIDSLTFAQNHTWYASNLEEYEKMQKKVEGRIEANKQKLEPKKDTITKKANPKGNLKVRKDFKIPATSSSPK